MMPFFKFRLETISHSTVARVQIVQVVVHPDLSNPFLSAFDEVCKFAQFVLDSRYACFVFHTNHSTVPQTS